MVVWCIVGCTMIEWCRWFSVSPTIVQCKPAPWCTMVQWKPHHGAVTCTWPPADLVRRGERLGLGWFLPEYREAGGARRWGGDTDTPGLTLIFKKILKVLALSVQI